MHTRTMTSTRAKGRRGRYDRSGHPSNGAAVLLTTLIGIVAAAVPGHALTSNPSSTGPEENKGKERPLQDGTLSCISTGSVRCARCVSTWMDSLTHVRSAVIPTMPLLCVGLKLPRRVLGTARGRNLVWFCALVVCIVCFFFAPKVSRSDGPLVVVEAVDPVSHLSVAKNASNLLFSHVARDDTAMCAFDLMREVGADLVRWQILQWRRSSP